MSRALTVVIALLCCGVAGAQVVLQPQPRVATGKGADVQAFPQVVASGAVTPEVAAKINTSLNRFNAEVAKDVQGCRKMRGFDWNRTIDVTMRGPQFLSMVATDGYDCGGPHPYDGKVALTYDLLTGLPVDWTKLIPGTRGEVIRSPGRLSIGLVHWPAMVARAKQQAGVDCEESYREPDAGMDVWLNAAKHTIVFAPLLAQHFDTATCGQQVEIGLAEARRLGFQRTLLDALAAAK